MGAEKTFIFSFDCPRTKCRRTALLQRYIDEELIPKFEIAALDGEYKTPSRFNKAFKEYRDQIEAGKPLNKFFDLLTFYGADFQRFIETCEGLRE